MIDPIRTVGIMGGGQLGRMLALAGYPLGLRFRFFDSDIDCTAGQVGPVDLGDFDDAEAVAAFAAKVDVITFEFENIPSASVQQSAFATPVLPSHELLAISQDRLIEKQLFQQLGLATPKFAGVGSRGELEAAIGYIGYPCVFKSRRFGYDGKGQAVIRSAEDIDTAWHAIGSPQGILEEWIDFDEEVSALGVRSRSGEIGLYPICHNTHVGGILRRTWVDPSDFDTPLSIAAHAALETVMQSQDSVGIIALELFVRRGQLIASEMAPRVHNSGHWSIDGAPTSQFSNHIRAICGLPLGDTVPAGPAGMVNIIGTLPDVNAILALPYARLHLYDKAPRPGRKLGHVNVLAETQAQFFERLEIVAGMIEA